MSAPSNACLTLNELIARLEGIRAAHPHYADQYVRVAVENNPREHVVQTAYAAGGALLKIEEYQI